MKKLIGTIILLILVLLLAAPAWALNPIKLVVNGVAVETDVPAQEINGRTMVPIRFVSQALGAEVEWDGATGTVIINGAGYNGHVDPAKLGAAQLPGIKIMVNGRLIDSDVPPQLVKERTMVPIRFVSEALGADVEWMADTQTVAIASPKTEEQNLGYYYNEEFGFKLKYPSGWEVTEDGGGVDISHSADDIFIRIEAYEPDPFLNRETLALTFANGLLSQADEELGYRLVETKEVAKGVGEYQPQVYTKYEVMSVEEKAGLLEQWTFDAGGKTFLVNLLTRDPAAGEEAVLRGALEEAEAILSTITATTDQVWEYQYYENPDWGFRVALPRPWTRYIDLDSLTAFQNDAGMSVVFSVVNLEQDTSVQDFLNTSRESIIDIYSEEIVQLGNEFEVTIAGGREGRMLDYGLSLEELQLHGEMYLLVEDGVGYSITLTMFDNVKENVSLRRAIQEMLDSIEIIK